MKHSRGPWHIENNIVKAGPYTPAALEIWNDNRHICSVNEHVDDFKIDQANANRIAASPELLAELETMVSILEKVTEPITDIEVILAYAKTVISKAKGEK